MDRNGCQTLTRALKRKDPATADHARRVERIASMIAGALGLGAPARRAVELAALLHDVGKIGVDDRILLKPGPLDAVEREQMRSHAPLGGELAREATAPMQAILAIRYHHERWDGRGYPEGLEGEAIPLESRIIAVADAFDAMTHDRPYRKAVSPGAAREEILRESGRQFDPVVVQAFLRTYDELLNLLGAATVQAPYGMV